MVDVVLSAHGSSGGRYELGFRLVELRWFAEGGHSTRLDAQTGNHARKPYITSASAASCDRVL